jgi:heavy metal efflux system protein
MALLWLMPEGERKFQIRVRYPFEYRQTEDQIARLKVPTLNNTRIILSEIAKITTITGPAFVYRDNNKRFIGVKFSVRERDLGSTIAEAQAEVNKNVKLSKGTSLTWTGEFENQVRATSRLLQVVPISLIGIFVLLFISLGSMKDAGLVLLNVPFALIGGILALHITGMNFGISAGVGFIALFGICVQNGVILISEFNDNLGRGESLDDAIKLGIAHRTRPVVMQLYRQALALKVKNRWQLLLLVVWLRQQC